MKLLESGFIPFLKFPPESYHSDTAFIDETKIKKGKRFYRLWLAVSKEGKLLFSWLSCKANTKVAKLVLLNTKSKKVITDKAPRYRLASRELGIEWGYETFGRRNVVERAFIPIKKRMKGFFKRFPANSKYKTVRSWLASPLTFRLALYGSLC